MSLPLWLELRNHLRLFRLDPSRKVIAILLRELADQVERRVERGDDRDPGETADWLRSEADRAWDVGP